MTSAHNPAISLAQARQRAEDARQSVRAGQDPSRVRQGQRQSVRQQRAIEKLKAAGLPLPDSFEAVALEWFAKHEPSWAASHSDKIIRRLKRDVFPWIGANPIASIKPPEILQLLKRVEERGAIETTHRVQQNCGQVLVRSSNQALRRCFPAECWIAKPDPRSTCDPHSCSRLP